MSLTIGKKSPSFELPDQTGHTQKLSAIEADFIVIYFYPKDDTPGCTLEGQQFTKLLKAYSSAGAKVYGISGLDYKSKAKFCIKQKIGVTLLSDPDFSIAKAFSSYGQKQFMGRSYMGILRNTFVLDEKKKIIKIFENIKPEGHAGEVLEFIKTQSRNAGSDNSGADKLVKVSNKKVAPVKKKAAKSPTKKAVAKKPASAKRK